MRRLLIWVTLIGVGAAAGFWRGCSLRPEPDWPVPSKYLTEVYEKERAFPSCPVVQVPEFVCRTADATFEPVLLELPVLKRHAPYAFEGSVVYPEWSESCCKIDVYEQAEGAASSRQIGGTVIRSFDRPHHGTYREERYAPNAPGRYRIWLEYRHPRGEPGDQLNLYGGADELSLRTIVAEGELMVTE